MRAWEFIELFVDQLATDNTRRFFAWSKPYHSNSRSRGGSDVNLVLAGACIRTHLDSDVSVK